MTIEYFPRDTDSTRGIENIRQETQLYGEKDEATNCSEIQSHQTLGVEGLEAGNNEL